MSEVKIIGHRGNQGYAVENSYAAIMDCSTNPNIDGTEFDIRITADNKIVVTHDSKLNNIRVCDLTLNEIQQMRFQTKKVDNLMQRIYSLPYKDKYFYQTYCLRGKQFSRITTLEDILKNFDKEKHMLIELKGLPGEYSREKQQLFEDSLIEILKKCDYQNRNIALEGYNIDALYRIKNKLPGLKIIALINKKCKLESFHKCFDGVSLEYPLINYDVIDKAIDCGLALYSWDDKRPIDHYKKIREYLNSDANITIISDFPEKAREYIKK